MEGYRELELYIGPFQEWKGIESVNAIKLVCNGNNDTLRIDASISKNIVSEVNTATITIYNLSQDTREAIRNQNVSIRLYAGYEGYKKEMVFSGGVKSAVSFRQGPNIITNLVCLAGAGPLIRTTVSKTYTYQVPVSDIVKEIASTIPGIVTDPENIKVAGTVGYSGWSFSGMAKDALDKLGNQFGFSWTIDDGKFVAIQDRKYIEGKLLLNSANGLRKVSPRLTGLEQFQEGVDIEAEYRPGVNPNHTVQVKSEFDKEIRTYMVYSVDYSLAPKTSSWDMKIMSFTL